ncbi:MAG: NAD(P)H-hydrate dehydratase [Oscillospiraceae bacterium]|nr:NAD(P)H-hydrate dehydratase [Oscillospiraceae bacterium]
MTEIVREQISLPRRKEDSHKGDFGKVLLLCGSKFYTGAAFFSAQAAVNTGSGLVFLSVPEKIRPTLSQKLSEPILISRKRIPAGFNAVLAGCGLSLERSSLRLVRNQLRANGAPLVCDADAITLIAREKFSLISSPRELVLTPHEGEFLRLCPEFDRSRREEFAGNFAKKNGCTLVLKGHRTVTATKSGDVFINTTGNPGMAKGGSGDILAGIITSLIGQGIPPERAAYIGVWLHGRAGDIAAEKYGEYAMTPSDMLESLKSAICEVERRS